MSKARFHEGITPATDTCVRLDAPWGRRVGNDIKPSGNYQTASFLSSHNRRIATIKKAFPITPGEIPDKTPLDYIAYKAGRQALRRIPLIYGFEKDHKKYDPWQDVTWDLGTAYASLHNKFIREREPECSEAELEQLSSRLVQLLTHRIKVEPYVVGGAKMLSQWLVLANLSQVGDASYTEHIKDTFSTPSIEQVRHLSYTGVVESNR